MKKLFAVAALSFFGMANAQKNTLLLGGNIGFSSEKTEFAGGLESKTNSFEFAPTIGYQFTDHWTLGINSLIGTGKTEAPGFAEAKTNEFKIGPFVRYAQSLGGAFAVYGDLGAGYQKLKTESGSVTTSDANGFYIGFTPALFINFKNSFGLNFSIGGFGYSSLKDSDADIKQNNFDFNFGKTVNIGISKNFNL
ncbi:outer membrane beta-barrel protein [uncultured Flavobacterium sp.]|uniref:outer membrane beta-barrel protein n=1 Tax=uncultured Flavobacterium sp. TaxID=165435 RepID=UPI0025EDD9A9|nr:outer membrane beta-barrel protein [uncultured Flavobacterium sp.]